MKNKIQNSLLMDRKVHYKMYKGGKHWLVAGIVTLGFGLSFALTSTSTKADTTIGGSFAKSGINLPQIEGTQTSKKISSLASELMFAQALEADDYTPQSDFTWQYNEDGTAYMKVFTGNQSIVNIPPTIVNPKDGKTYTVTRIDGNYGSSGWGAEAPDLACLNGLINNPNITSLTIPGTVKTLYAGTIGTLPNLVSFKLSEGVTTISQSIRELGPGPNDFWEIFWNSRNLTYLYLPTTLKNFFNPNKTINTLIGRSTSPLTRLTNVDFVFNNFNYLYADYGGSSPTPLTDFTDINYYIPDEQGYLDDPDIVQWTKADGTRLPVTMSEFQNASYDANTKKFKINPGKTSIKYRVTIDLSSLNKPNETMNITLPIFRGNINVKDSEYSVGDTFSAKNNYVNGLNADGNNLAWNDPAVKAEVTDSHGNPVALDQITQHDGEYNIKYIYTYGFNQKKYTSKSAKIRVKQVNNIKVSLVATNTGTTLVTDKKAEGEPRTEDVLDLGPNSTFLKSIIPAGYHYARSNEELNGHTQPISPKYGPIDQSLTVYVVGDLIKPGDRNAVTVHHYLKDTTTLVPGMSDVHRGGRVGDTLTFNLTDPEQVAPAGYKLVEGQQNQSWTLQHDQGKVINFYYEALIQDNITIDFVDVNTGETVIAKKPGGTHHTGEELDLNSTDVTSKIPAGYHIAKGSELNGKTQPSNPKYTTEDQTTKVFIVGDKIADDATNAVTVHHYFKDTTTPVPGMSDVHKGGRVGETLKFKLTDPEQKAPDGYELSAGQTDQEWTLKHDEGKTIIFYYEAKTQDNITIKFGDAMNPGKVISTTKPTGHRTGDTLDLSSDEVISNVPKGYHVATKDELKDLKDANGKQLSQPENPKYTTSPQSPTLWIIGDKIAADSENAVKVRHYLKDTKTPVPGMTDIQKGGRVGDKFKFKLTDPEQKAPKGYKLAPDQTDQEWTLSPDGGKEIIFYYTADSLDNITVEFIDVTTGKKLGSTKPTGHHTGEELDLSGTEVTSKIPRGYHVAKDNELNGKEQPKNPKYTTEDQTKQIFIIGDIIENDAKNAVTVRHYLKGTTTPVPGMNDIHKGGRVGETLKFKLTDDEQKAPTGYELSAGQTDQEWTLTPDGGKEIIFYYDGSSSENITIIFKDTDGNTVGTSVPKGHRTGDVLEISEDGLKGNVPKGYHVATKEELNGKTDSDGKPLAQPDNPIYGSAGQDVPVYVVANPADYITVEFVDKDTNETLSTFKPTGKHFNDQLKLDNTSLTEPEHPLYQSFKALKDAGYEYVSSELASVTYDDPENKPKTVKVYVKKQPAATSNASIQIRFLTKTGKSLPKSQIINLNVMGVKVGNEYDITNKIIVTDKKYRLTFTQPEKYKFKGIAPESGTIVINVYCEKIR